MNAIAQTSHGPVEYRIVGQGPAILVLNGGHTNCHSPLGRLMSRFGGKLFNKRFVSLIMCTKR